MSSVNAAALHICGGELSDPLLLDLRCGTDCGHRGPCGGPFLKTGVFRFCLGTGVDNACLCYLFVACDEIRQPRQLFAIWLKTVPTYSLTAGSGKLLLATLIMSGFLGGLAITFMARQEWCQTG